MYLVISYGSGMNLSLPEKKNAVQRRYPQHGIQNQRALTHHLYGNKYNEIWFKPSLNLVSGWLSNDCLAGCSSAAEAGVLLHLGGPRMSSLVTDPKPMAQFARAVFGYAN